MHSVPNPIESALLALRSASVTSHDLVDAFKVGGVKNMHLESTKSNNGYSLQGRSQVFTFSLSRPDAAILSATLTGVDTAVVLFTAMSGDTLFCIVSLDIKKWPFIAARAIFENLKYLIGWPMPAGRVAELEALVALHFPQTSWSVLHTFFNAGLLPTSEDAFVTSLLARCQTHIEVASVSLPDCNVGSGQ